MTDEVIALLEQIREAQHRLAAEVAALREAVERGREPERPPKFQDRNAMAKILPVLADNFHGTFGAWELIDCAEAKDALGADLRLVLGKLSTQQLGQLFQRTAGHDFGGLRIIREGRDGNGARWRCCVTPASLSPRKNAPTLRSLKP